jgi:hypothetical protein
MLVVLVDGVYGEDRVLPDERVSMFLLVSVAWTITYQA